MTTRILVVDDEPDLQPLILHKFRNRIKNKEIEFIFATNGKEALEKLRQDTSIEVIISDINMPEMDGLTLLAEATELRRELRTVIVSAYGDMDNIRTAMNRGAFDFVVKPINFNDLEATVEKSIKDLEKLKMGLAAKQRLLYIDNELEVAHNIQTSVVPTSFPIEKEIEISGSMYPAKEVGGDFFDVFPISEDKIGFVIGDVSGKGIHAALFMMMTSILFKTIAGHSQSAADCMTQVNHLLNMRNTTTMFVTAIYGTLSKTGLVEYCSSGHLYPILMKKDGVVNQLEAGGMALGISEDFGFENKTIQLEPQSTLFVYTDGINEAMNQEGELFSIERLEKILSQVVGSSLDDIQKVVLEKIREHSMGCIQSDDIAMVVMRYLG